MIMGYKKCPRCNLNYIPETETLCEECKKTSVIDGIKRNKREGAEYSCITYGKVYGTNTRTIYEGFCRSLGWDWTKRYCFGFQTPLYAENCDTTRENDVWFICYPNYDPEKLDCVVKDRHVVNLIQNNGDEIIEIVEEKIGPSHNARRITFVKTLSGYKFSGVYELVKNGTTRRYKRISKFYPF